MKRFISSCLLFTFIGSLFCANYLLHVQFTEIKKEGKLALFSDNEFHTKVFSLNDFKRFKLNDHELCIQGNYFEYKQLQCKSNKVHLVVKFDAKETKFEKWKHKQNKSSKKSPKKLGFQLFVHAFTSPDLHTIKRIKKPQFSYTNQQLRAVDFSKLDPPQTMF